ncbi:hypothetical protein DFH09DRAFT_1489007 [Mycena vulgaris]|nr:hypothetical protein DFH09DRAFT_1489007 [Mycena vulgaris]
MGPAPSFPPIRDQSRSGAKPFPRNEDYRSPPPSPPPLPPAYGVDPSLGPISQSPDTPLIIPAEIPTPMPTPLATQTARRKCANAPKYIRLATAKSCLFVLCKPCCLVHTGCKYPQHRDSTPTIAANGNPSALSRPPSIIPVASTSTLSIDGPTSAPSSTKIYRKPMDDAWAEQYQNGLAVQQKRREIEDKKRPDIRRVQNEVRFCYFPEDGKVPEHLRDQDVDRYPYYNLADSAKMMRKLGLEGDDEINIYNFRGGVWLREDLTTTMLLVPGQTILIKPVAVTVCAQIDEMILLYAPSVKAGKSKRKPDRDRDPSNRVIQVAKISNAPRRARTRSSSLPLRPSSPKFPSVSTLLSMSRSSSSSSAHIDLTTPPTSPSSSPSSRSRSLSLPTDPNVSIDADTDNLGHVVVTPGLGTWPAGVYTRDMASAFGKTTLSGVLSCTGFIAHDACSSRTGDAAYRRSFDGPSRAIACHRVPHAANAVRAFSSPSDVTRPRAGDGSRWLTMDRQWGADLYHISAKQKLGDCWLCCWLTFHSLRQRSHKLSCIITLSPLLHSPWPSSTSWDPERRVTFACGRRLIRSAWAKGSLRVAARSGGYKRGSDRDKPQCFHPNRSMRSRLPVLRRYGPPSLSPLSGTRCKELLGSSGGCPASGYGLCTPRILRYPPRSQLLICPQYVYASSTTHSPEIRSAVPLAVERHQTRRVTRIVWWVSYSWIWAVYSPYPGVLTSLAPDLWTDQKPGFQAVRLSIHISAFWNTTVQFGIAL